MRLQSALSDAQTKITGLELRKLDADARVSRLEQCLAQLEDVVSTLRATCKCGASGEAFNAGVSVVEQDAAQQVRACLLLAVLVDLYAPP